MSRVWYVVGGIVALGLIFQIFFRFEYVHQSTGFTFRIDRLTQASCVMPCIPAPPTPKPTPFDKDVAKYDFDTKVSQADEDAIEMVKDRADVRSLIDTYRLSDAVYKWHADPSNPYNDLPQTTSSEKEDVDQVRLVCYCTTAGFGYRWEAHLGTRMVYYVNDNAELMKKYNLHQGA